MNSSENIQQFYKRICHQTDEVLTAVKPHINIFERAACKGVAPYSRRDYYKVTLIRGKGLLEYADRAFEVEKTAVLFSTPKVPYRWIPSGGAQLGWFCIFNEPFAKQQDELLSRLPMFQVGTDKLFYPDLDTENEIAFFFEKMMTENAANYQHKQDLLRNYLHLIIHQVLKMQPAHQLQSLNNASERITAMFLELLERQFPIDANFNVLELKSAKDFAAQLSVHTNHLNRAVKEVTGETTSHHISRRIIAEANDMLRNTSWQISEIAFALGFEEPAYFNTFYKKNTGFTPKEVRNPKVVV
ncbi:helix-turn-helix domain-containing protein [Epilithonimonas hominis]|uniref:helix-turn-helix domain-containing protein n=1 Tax=Epilithonimonas hominis TaxID=420404 RepID=UPI00143E1A2C|nr:helix-turn-helix domain-containing protein [Epilithonimonas hominis]QIY82173.1 AraC family transcriptional regulator [Chryseobacterium sp. NEB161]